LSLTEIRKAMAAPLADLPGTVKVAVGESKEGADLERMVVGVVVGPLQTPAPAQGGIEPLNNVDTTEVLDELLEDEGERSVKARLEADRTLGGAVADLFVAGHSGYCVYPSPKGPQLGAEWTVTYTV